MAIGKKKLEQKGPSVDEAMDAMNSSEKKLAVVTNKDAFVPLGDGTFKYKRFKLTRKGLDAPQDVEESELDELGYRLAEISKTIGWWIGDWANKYPGEHGEKYTALADKFGLAEHTVKNKAWLSRSVEMSRRRDELSEGHHDAVASLDPDDQDDLLQQAVENGWSVKEIRQAKKLLLSGESDHNDAFVDVQKQIDTIDKSVADMDKHYRDELFKKLLDVMRKYGYID